MNMITGHTLACSLDRVVSRVARRHALTMLHRGVATVREPIGGQRVGPYLLPESLDLVREVDFAVFQRTGAVPYSKRALAIRDRGLCGYCGGPGDTMDHIVPKSRGGPADWTNTVLACLPCNQRKADRTPVEAGMVLRRPPYAPTWLDIYEPQGSAEESATPLGGVADDEREV